MWCVAKDCVGHCVKPVSCGVVCWAKEEEEKSNQHEITGGVPVLLYSPTTSPVSVSDKFWNCSLLVPIFAFRFSFSLFSSLTPNSAIPFHSGAAARLHHTPHSCALTVAYVASLPSAISVFGFCMLLAINGPHSHYPPYHLH